MDRALEMPPKRGFPPVRIRQNLKAKGWAPGTIAFVATVVMVWGHYRLYTGNRHKRKLVDERKFMEFAMYPFLQAERDLTLVLENRAVKKKLDRLMADDIEYDPKLGPNFYYRHKHYVPSRYPIKLHHFEGLWDDEELY